RVTGRHKPKAREIFKQLVTKSDVVIEGMRPGILTEWKLDYEDLIQLNQRIIMISCAIQGRAGPQGSYAGYGFDTLGLAGFANYVGWPDRAPVGSYDAYGDLVVPWYALTAILAALDHRRRTNKGAYIDVSQIDTGVHFLSPAILDYTVNNRMQSRSGNRSSSFAPHNAYCCKGDDRWCTIAVTNDREWRAFCDTAGELDWINHPNFATALARKENEDELDKLIEAWTIDLTPEDVMTKLQAVGVAAAVVKTAQDIFDDPQVKFRDYLPIREHAEIGACHHQGWPALLSKTPYQLRAAPCLGQDNEYVYQGLLSISDEEFVELVQSGVIE
ncbi:MAG: CoA transferase, partial [Chloroflexota bacterium]|nr:CoA transferase [Chloroflexota bacterium]